MTADDVRAIVEREIAGNWGVTNDHGCDLRRCLVLPTKKPYENSFKPGEYLELWLVLEENPENPSSGYKIVFDEDRRDFGLAIVDEEGRGLFIAAYGSFLNTFKGM
jgi:hypothetical protein